MPLQEACMHAIQGIGSRIHARAADSGNTAGQQSSSLHVHRLMLRCALQSGMSKWAKSMHYQKVRTCAPNSAHVLLVMLPPPPPPP